MTVSIRSAAEKDADFLAWVILAATRSHLPSGWFDIVLDGPESARLDFLRRLTLTRIRSLWHYSRFHIAEADGIPAAALCTLFGSEFEAWAGAISEVSQQLGWSESDRRATLQRGAYLATCLSETDPNTWAIENVATLPEYRGRGIAGRMIEHALAEGRRNGAREAQITFFIGNAAAERAYAKAGFQFKDEKRHPDFEGATGAPGLRRFAREI